MNKITKWSIVGVIVLGSGFLAYQHLMPHENKEMKEAPKEAGNRQSKALNVRAVVLSQQGLTDGIFVSGSLVPDEEVSLLSNHQAKSRIFSLKKEPMWKKGNFWPKLTMLLYRLT